MNRNLIETKSQAEKAILVCTTIPKSSTAKTLKQKIYKEHLDELEFLAQTAGAVVIDKFYQERDKIDSSFYIGKGKANEIARRVEEENIDLVIFENTLSPTQIRNLEKVIKCKVLDKPALILDIFASNARTAEAKTQVELAQLQYLLPRLTRQWTHLSKQLGGIGTKGPGETQIETDRRLISTRISMLKDKLKKVEEQRKTQRQQRYGFTRIALVGYTNVGKSTLLNILTNAGVYVENKLFATLDTSTKLLKEINGRKFPQPTLISDTVGFIRNLPHDLIESFKSTLAEVVEADILIHLVDISSESFEEQIKVVNETLADLGVGSSNADSKYDAENRKIILAFNKVDSLAGQDKKDMLDMLRSKYPDAIFISAQKGINLNSLYNKIFEMMEDGLVEAEIKIPNSSTNAYRLLSMLYGTVDILETKHLAKSIKLKIRAQKSEVERLQKLLNENKNIERKDVSPARTRAKRDRVA